MGSSIEMKLVFSNQGQKQFRKIKDKFLRHKMLAQLKKVLIDPFFGKPLRYDLKLYRSLRVHPFRIIYSITENSIVVHAIDHRKKVYSFKDSSH